MEYTTLGSTGMTVSRIRLGCMSFGSEDWRTATGTRRSSPPRSTGGWTRTRTRAGSRGRPSSRNSRTASIAWRWRRSTATRPTAGTTRSPSRRRYGSSTTPFAGNRSAISARPRCGPTSSPTRSTPPTAWASTGSYDAEPLRPGLPRGGARDAPALRMGGRRRHPLVAARPRLPRPTARGGRRDDSGSLGLRTGAPLRASLPRRWRSRDQRAGGGTRRREGRLDGPDRARVAAPPGRRRRPHCSAPRASNTSRTPSRPSRSICRARTGSARRSPTSRFRSRGTPEPGGGPSLRAGRGGRR